MSGGKAVEMTLAKMIFVKRMKKAFAAALLVAGLCGASGGFAARAESSEPAAAGDTANGRYAMTPVADGFLRLDTRSGQVSLCTIQKDQAQCRASADERAALQAEIDRLAKENAALKTPGSLAPGVNPKAAAEEEDDRRFDKALDRAERFMRRMMQLFRDPNGKPPPTSL
jgi:hypothetical protein